MTLRWRLTVAFVLVVLVPLLVGLALVARALPRAVQDRQQHEVAAAAALVAQVLQDYCDRATTTAEAVGRASTTTATGEVRVMARALVERGRAEGIQVLGPTGTVLVSVGRLPSQPTDCGSTPVANPGTYLSAVVPLTTARGRPGGTAIASFDVSGALLQRVSSAAGQGDILLLTGSGDVVAGTTKLPARVVHTAIRGVRNAREVSSYVAPSAGQGLGVLVLQPAA